ncbi:hypothetical protein [Mesorhizobium sp. SP-1A]|uniref:hypothetical protein n=1 Tax=Mesorhizobium sp. SP-1A TaxID=3077840 RepID=UPI0028F6D233|nr:hypothetical protein [Mesorhizobium sp. SP-1A]
MRLHSETPPLRANAGNGGSVFDKVWTPSEYRNPPLSATDMAASIISRRFRLSISTARLVCELAGIGGLRT